MSESHSDLNIRLLMAIIPMGIAFGIIFNAINVIWGLAFLIPCLLAVALIIVPSLASVLGEDLCDFLFPQRWDETPKAPVFKVNILIINKQWDEAESYLTELGREFPHDMEVWSHLFRLTWVQIGDQDRARACHRIALQCTNDPSVWDHINYLYTVDGQSHLGFGEAWEKEEDSMQRRTAIAELVVGIPR